MCLQVTIEHGSDGGSESDGLHAQVRARCCAPTKCGSCTHEMQQLHLARKTPVILPSVTSSRGANHLFFSHKWPFLLGCERALALSCVSSAVTNAFSRNCRRTSTRSGRRRAKSSPASASSSAACSARTTNQLTAQSTNRQPLLEGSQPTRLPVVQPTERPTQPACGVAASPPPSPLLLHTNHEPRVDEKARGGLCSHTRRGGEGEGCGVACACEWVEARSSAIHTP